MGTAAAALVCAAATLRIVLNPGAPLHDRVAAAEQKIIKSVKNVANVAEAEPGFFEHNYPGDQASQESDLSKIETAVIGSMSTPKPEKTSNAGVAVVSSRAYLVGNITTGKVYLTSNANTPYPVASMSKLVTTLVTLYSLSSTSTIEITEEMVNNLPDGKYVFPGEKYTAEELLYPMLLSSSNVAAEALASASDRRKFLELMSSYAWEIGMPETFFADPSGLDAHNTASASNIFALARYLYNFHPDVLAMTRKKQFSVNATSGHDAHVFYSIHPFVNDPRFIGGKTGRTPQARETMLTILNINNQPIAFVVLGSDFGKRENDTRILVSKYLEMTKTN